MKQQIISKVNRSKKGTIFLPDSFLPVDAHYAANILSELSRDGKLIRVAFGIYVKPYKTELGPVMPTLGEIAQAIAKRDRAKILPTGATAENYLGFTTQVPMNAVYLTSGTSRTISIGKRTLTFKHSVPTTFAYRGAVMPILVLALKSIGRRNITDEILSVVSAVLKQNPEEKTWRKDLQLAPRWITLLVTKTKEAIINNEVD